MSKELVGEFFPETFNGFLKDHADCRIGSQNDAPCRQLISRLIPGTASTDFIGDSKSSRFKVKAGLALDNGFLKFVVWFDNEWGYIHRVVDLIVHMASLQHSPFYI